MRGMGGRTFEIALVLGLGFAVPVLAADPPEDPDAPPTGWRVAPWLQKRIDEAHPPKPKPKKPPTKTDQAKTDQAKPVAAKPMPRAETPQSERDREEKDFLRRLAVCDQLLKIAQETHDEQLERKAQQLNERAWAVYAQRVSQIPAVDAFESDEKTLDRHLTAIPPPRPVRLPKDSAVTRVSGIQHDSRAEFLYGTGE